MIQSLDDISGECFDLMAREVVAHEGSGISHQAMVVGRRELEPTSVAVRNAAADELRAWDACCSSCGIELIEEVVGYRELDFAHGIDAWRREPNAPNGP